MLLEHWFPQDVAGALGCSWVTKLLGMFLRHWDAVGALGSPGCFWSPGMFPGHQGAQDPARGSVGSYPGMFLEHQVPQDAAGALACSWGIRLPRMLLGHQDAVGALGSS